MIPSSYPASCDSFRTCAVDPGSGDLREEEACRSTWSCSARGVCLFLRYRNQPQTNKLVRNSSVRFAGNGRFWNRSFKSIAPTYPNGTSNSNRSQPSRYGRTRNIVTRRRNAAVLEYLFSSSAENLSSTALFLNRVITQLLASQILCRYLTPSFCRETKTRPAIFFCLLLLGTYKF